MNSKRVELLMKYIEDEPDNPFNQYALALEYLSGNQKLAASLFDQLLIHHPDYLPTYYQAGLLKAEEGKLPDALRILRTGIELARKEMNTKVLRELQQAMNEIEGGD